MNAQLNDRQLYVVELLETVERVSVAEVAKRFDVSDMTVRRDLEGLERTGVISRIHGGAVLARSRSYEPPFSARLGRNVDGKQRIGLAAASLLVNGETVILDAGTTTLEIAKSVRGKLDLKVLAMSLHIAVELASDPRITLMMSGGIVRFGERSLIGAGAEKTFADYSFDTFFMTVGGIDLHTGVTEYNAEDAAVKLAAFRCARRRIVVADGSKIGRTAFAKVCEVGAVDILLTDESAPAPKIRELLDLGVDVRVV